MQRHDGRSITIDNDGAIGRRLIGIHEGSCEDCGVGPFGRQQIPTRAVEAPARWRNSSAITSLRHSSGCSGESRGRAAPPRCSGSTRARRAAACRSTGSGGRAREASRRGRCRTGRGARSAREADSVDDVVEGASVVPDAVVPRHDGEELGRLAQRLRRRQVDRVQRAHGLDWKRTTDATKDRVGDLDEIAATRERLDGPESATVPFGRGPRSWRSSTARSRRTPRPCAWTWCPAAGSATAAAAPR